MRPPQRESPARRAYEKSPERAMIIRPHAPRALEIDEKIEIRRSIVTDPMGPQVKEAGGSPFGRRNAMTAIPGRIWRETIIGRTLIDPRVTPTSRAVGAILHRCSASRALYRGSILRTAIGANRGRARRSEAILRKSDRAAEHLRR
jgi:hypothetical protein